MTTPEPLYVTRTGNTVLGLIQLELLDGSRVLVNKLNLGTCDPRDATRDDLERRRSAVIELHAARPDDHRFCSICHQRSDDRDDYGRELFGARERWPCPTLRALGVLSWADQQPTAGRV